MKRFKEMFRFRWRTRAPRGEATSAAEQRALVAPTIREGADFSITAEAKTFDEVRISISGKIFMENAQLVLPALLSVMEAHPLENTVIDLAGVEYLDSSGAAVLMEAHRRASRLNNVLRLSNVPSAIRTFLGMVDFEQFKDLGILEPREEPGVMVQIGDGALELSRDARDMVTFIGATVVALLQDFSRPRKIRWDRLWKLLAQSGFDAVPIVTLLSFLMGAILAFQSAIQFRKFGANIFVADLVSVAICLEMGPLLTSLIVAGRSGAAYAAHIGTMQVNEEVDALRALAIDPIRFLVSPRLIACAIALPCLTVFADLVGVLGGCVVATFSLDLTPQAFFNQVHKVLEVSDIAKGLIKSVVFGVEIAVIGCMKGFQVRGGAESVGHATTSAVVTGIFVLTVTDAIFAILYYYLAVL
ncbi:MAG: MlaE family lipid ABC transporter permease subunit [Desulfomonile tiedjei]|nr:MlaE family lipid ABC transporter permease subunit [Desulfomonile tiedjei]